MKLYLKNHHYQYAIQNMAHIFYPEESVAFVDHSVTQSNGDIAVNSVLKDEQHQVEAFTEVYDGKVKASASVARKYDAKHIKDTHQYHRLCREAVTLSFYRAAKKIRKANTPWGILMGIRPTKIVHELMADGKSDREIIDILTNRYAVSDEKKQLVLQVAHHERNILRQLHPNSAGLYIGIPFCPTRCIYCSFVSNAVYRAQQYIQPYLDALIKEIRYTQKIIGHMGWHIPCVYIGGGTPTVLTPLQLEKLLDAVYTQLDRQGIKEFTVEAGRPDTIDTERLKVLKKYNVTRLSINPQTMNRPTLKKIGRLHTPEDIVRSFALARDLGFNNINMDVIVGLPDETVDMYKHTLAEIQKLDPENITVHTMSIKRGSRLNEKKGAYVLSQSHTVREMLSYTQQFMRQNCKSPYYLYRQKNMLGNLENVGYCKPGQESIYNIQIMEEQHTIVGMGCGAVTKMVDTRKNHIDRIFNVKEVSDYIGRIDEMIQRKDKIYDYFGVKRRGEHE